MSFFPMQPPFLCEILKMLQAGDYKIPFCHGTWRTSSKHTFIFSENVFLGRTLIIFDPIHAHFSCHHRPFYFCQGWRGELVFLLTYRPVPQPWHAYSFTIQDENGENFVVCVVSLEFLSQDPCSCCYFWGGFSSRAGTWQLCRWDGRSSPLASLPEVDGRNQAPAPFHQHRWAK